MGRYSANSYVLCFGLKLNGIIKQDTKLDIILDITVATTHGADYHVTQPGDMADKAEKRKRDKWKQCVFDMTTRIVVFAIDQSVALGKSTRNFLRELAGPCNL